MTSGNLTGWYHTPIPSRDKLLPFTGHFPYTSPLIMDKWCEELADRQKKNKISSKWNLEREVSVQYLGLLTTPSVLKLEFSGPNFSAMGFPMSKSHTKADFTSRKCFVSLLIILHANMQSNKNHLNHLNSYFTRKHALWEIPPGCAGQALVQPLWLLNNGKDFTPSCLFGRPNKTKSTRSCWKNVYNKTINLIKLQNKNLEKK